MQTQKDREQKEQQQKNTADQNKEVFERTGSNDHNDYSIHGNEHQRDEKESYVDYNGNSEANNPARAQE